MKLSQNKSLHTEQPVRLRCALGPRSGSLREQLLRTCLKHGLLHWHLLGISCREQRLLLSWLRLAEKRGGAWRRWLILEQATTGLGRLASEERCSRSWLLLSWRLGLEQTGSSSTWH